MLTKDINVGLADVSFRQFRTGLGALLEQKSLAVYSSKVDKAYSFINLLLALTVQLPLPHVLLVQLLDKPSYRYLHSPVPAVAFIQDNMKFVANTLSANLSSQAVHVDIDKGKRVGTLKFKLEKVFKNHKAMHRAKECYEKLQQRSPNKPDMSDFDDPDNLYLVELVTMLRTLLNEIYMFDDQEIRKQADKRAYILSKTKIDKSLHAHLLNTQIFATLYQDA